MPKQPKTANRKIPRTPAKRASYKDAIRWIAVNDEPTLSKVENLPAVAQMISVCLIADLFGKETDEVAFDIVAFRRALEIRERE